MARLGLRTLGGTSRVNIQICQYPTYGLVIRLTLLNTGRWARAYGKGGAAVQSLKRCLILGLASTTVPIAVISIAPPAKADCNYAGGSTVCAQGTVRGADGVPRAATPVVPYPCENDWYCGTEWDLDVDWNPGPPIDIGRPGRPGGGGGIGPRR